MRKQSINEVMVLKAEKRKKNRVRIKKLIFWIKFISIVALLATALVFTALSPLFNLRAFEVNGAVHYKGEELGKAFGYTDGRKRFKAIGSSPGT